SGQPVRWNTTNAAVATVTTGGQVTAVATGEAEVAVTCLGLRRTCRVTVIPPMVTVTLDKHEATLHRNDIVYLTATTAPSTEEVQWSTSNADVALVRVVDGRAMVLAMRPGEAHIVAATAARCHPDTCHVTVVRPTGDANGDGFADVEDLNAVINVILGFSAQPAGDDLPFYDTTGDGVVDVEDVNALVNLLLNPEPPTPPEPQNRTFTVNGVTFKMVAVEGGTFTMGATEEQGSDAYDWEKPTHQVTLSSYSIGETEVTQALWQAVMGSNPSHFTGNLQRPVERVSWNDCQTFITKLNELTGATFRLLTEAEWEYAARGGNKSKGYKYAGSNTIGGVAWYSSNSSSTTHPVATKAPNELGLYDMSGNVWEWCQDWYGNYSSEAQTNPTGPTSGSSRVDRGGGGISGARNCRVSNRDLLTPSLTPYDQGLRLAL
ncbi:MAG: SUMF1/EgtB/PvdO family nonheme iron enzyme, partial [Muribaculaceae bacterium]|nr:SUMF1/EgtB/PvdO family nonheme iron enzyme [Muribaculaceae bacterium]